MVTASEECLLQQKFLVTLRVTLNLLLDINLQVKRIIMGYKFEGITYSASLKVDLNMSGFSVYLQTNLTMYHYGNIQLPIGNRKVPDCGILGVIFGFHYTF